MKGIFKRFLILAVGNRLAVSIIRLLNRDELRIIYYHRVVESGSAREVMEPGMFVSQDAFDAQISFLREQYHPVSEAEVISAINGKTKLPLNAVWVTFDDGYKDNFTLGYPVLKKYGVPATFFVTTGYVNGQYYPSGFQADRDAFMSWDDIRALSRDGFAIGAHTVSHPAARQLTEEELDKEVASSRKEIELRTGLIVRSFAYPFGKQVHVDVKKGTPVLKINSMEVAVTTTGGVNQELFARRFELRRFGASYEDDIRLFRFKVAISGIWQT